MNTKKTAAVLTAVLLLFTSGCTVAKFESPEQAKQKAEEKNRLSVQSATVAPQSMLADELAFTRTLETSGGVQLASYTAYVPQFVTGGAKTTVFERLNAFYHDEYDVFEEDCTLFFNYVKQSYGDKWDSTTAEKAKPQSTTFTYEMLDAPEAYISFMRTFETTDAAGASETRYYGEVFDRETGWRLKFADLFGANTTKAESLLMEQLKAWCDANKLSFDTAETLTAAELTDEFAVTQTELIVCIDPFALSADDGAGHLCRLPLSAFQDLMGAVSQ
ncbi:MAG: hypothetical protein ABT01_01810 [Clostridium sp. SCN 57-10]|nr:MAG: hypothetical protein ABT01_01810 [Clostridium sp. SCN 57-10]